MTLILSRDPLHEVREGARIVRTPLDLITALDGAAKITRVILAGTFERDREMHAFLRESYPAMPVLDQTQL